MASRVRTIARKTAATMAFVAAGAIATAPMAAAAGTLAGGVTLSPSSGGSSTSLTLNLPAQAGCGQGHDTASAGYHVFSYITQADPSTLTFSANGPSSGFPLYDTTGTAYTAAATAPNTGQFQALPQFNFANFGSTDQGGNLFALPPGDYHIGIACAAGNGAEGQFYDTGIHFDASGSDPNGEVWSAPSTPTPANGNNLAVPIAALGVVGIGALVTARRRRSAAGVS